MWARGNLCSGILYSVLFSKQKANIQNNGYHSSWLVSGLYTWSKSCRNISQRKNWFPVYSLVSVFPFYPSRCNIFSWSSFSVNRKRRLNCNSIAVIVIPLYKLNWVNNYIPRRSDNPLHSITKTLNIRCRHKKTLYGIKTMREIKNSK